MATFSNLVPICAPGYTMDFIFSASIPSTDAVLRVYFRNCVVGEYYGDRICQSCANGTYSFVDPSNLELGDIGLSICEECPSQASQCYKDKLFLKEGYWRMTETSTVIFECPLSSESCIGGPSFGNALCTKGYKDTLCSVCEEGYTRQSVSHTCEECSSDKVKFNNPLLYIFLLAMIAISIYLYTSWRKVRQIKSFDEFAYFMLVNLGFMSEDKELSHDNNVSRVRALRLSTQTRLNIYGTFFQIVVVIPYVLDLKVSSALSSVLFGLSGILNLSITDSSILSCDLLQNFDFIHGMLIDTLIPVLVLVVLWVSYRIHSKCFLPPATNDFETMMKHNKVRGTYFKFFLIYSVIITPYVSIQIFKT